MLTRVLGIGGVAVVVLVAAPAVIVNTVNPNTTAAPRATLASALSATPTATLKITVSGERGKDAPLYVAVRAVGSPPAPARLADDAGIHIALVRPAQGHCEHLPVHDTLAGPGERVWCLAVTGLDAGHTLTGVLSGGTKLTLSLTRRHSFWSWPLVVLVLGLLTPLATGFVVSALKRFAGEAEVAQLASEHPEIHRLGDWAKAHAEVGASDGDVLEAVKRVVRGAPQIVQARERLADALRHTQVEPDHPYVVAAWAEARRRVILASDIVDDNGAPKAAAAADYLAHLAQLEADRAVLIGLQKALDAIDGDHAFDARLALDRATEMYKRASTPADIAGLTQPLVDATAAIEAAAVEPQALQVDSAWFNEHIQTTLDNFELCSAGSGGAGNTQHVLVKAFAQTPEALSDALSHIRVVTTSPLDLSGEELKWDEGFWLIVTVVAAAAALAFAGTVVAQKAYFANPAFATGWDYFTLFSTALASGSAATVLGLFRYWRPTTPA